MINKFKNNKQGIAFPVLIPIFTVLLFALLVFFAIRPINDIKSNIEFGGVITQVDSLIMLKPAQEFYEKSELSNAYINTRRTFTQSIELGSSANQLGLLDSNKMIVCKLGNLNLWYNEINIESSTNDKIYENCLPKFGNVNQEYLDYFKGELLSSVGDSDSFDVEILPSLKNNDNENIYSVKLSVLPKANSKFSNVHDSYIIEKEINIGSYSNLLKVLNEIIPTISTEFRTQVPICMENKDAVELDCMKKVLEELISKRNPNISKEYKFELNLIEDVGIKTEGKYYGLGINVLNSIENSETLSFGLILKDTIPYAPLQFEVESSKTANNFINILIQKPNFAEEVSSYLVMYSYEDFLSSSHPKNKEFISMLEKGEIPTSMLTDTSLTDSNSNKFFYSNDLGLTVILSSGKDFEKLGENEIEKKSVSIYQIFNTETKKFELIGKPVFVYAFALDKNYNLFINDIENNAKLGIPVNVFGPMPPSKEKSILVGDIIDLENSLSLSIKEYQDSNFNHFNIYVLDKNINPNVKFVKNCEGQETGCYFLDGAGVLTKDKFSESGAFNYLITSVDEELSFPNVVRTNQFTPNFVLENGKNYDVYVIAVGNDNVGMISGAAIKKFEVQDTVLNFQILTSNFIQMVPLSFISVKIIDKKAPTLEDVEINGWNVVGQNNIYLKWKSKKINDVKELDSSLIIYLNDGTKIGSTPIKIGIDGKVVTWKDEYNRIELNGIQIIDYSNNFNSDNNFKLTYPEIVNE